MFTRLLFATGTFTCMTFAAQAQAALTVGDLMELRNKRDIGLVQNMLSKKGWVYKGESITNRSIEACNTPELTWSYIPKPGVTDGATFNLYKGDNCNEVVDYFMYSFTVFNALKEEVSRNPYLQLKGSRAQRSFNGQSVSIVERYESEKTYVEFATLPPANGSIKQTYGIKVGFVR